MSATPDFGFGKFVPGFDFLQNIAKGASQAMPQVPHLSSWIAPTLSVEELDKRISEMKAVQFWLEQNGKALGATIQALEVQKMTLSTLEGMNFRMADLADALKLRPEAAAKAPAAAPRPARSGAKPAAEAEAGKGGAAAVDPLQWWGSLTQQFQQIAANAMKDVAEKTAADTAGATQDAMKAAGNMMKAASEAAGLAKPAAKPARAAKGAGQAAPPGKAKAGGGRKAAKAPARKRAARKMAEGG